MQGPILKHPARNSRQHKNDATLCTRSPLTLANTYAGVTWQGQTPSRIKNLLHTVCDSDIARGGILHTGRGLHKDNISTMTQCKSHYTYVAYWKRKLFQRLFLNKNSRTQPTSNRPHHSFSECMQRCHMSGGTLRRHFARRKHCCCDRICSFQNAKRQHHTMAVGNGRHLVFAVPEKRHPLHQVTFC